METKANVTKIHFLATKWVCMQAVDDNKKNAIVKRITY